jgi:hypothetical protein
MTARQQGNVVLLHRWILQRLRHKTDLVLKVFPSNKKTTVIQKLTEKTLHFLYYLNLLSEKDHYMKHLLSYASTFL